MTSSIELPSRYLSSSDVHNRTSSFEFVFIGHNLPDRNGNRYCINLVSVAGKPEDGSEL